MVNSFFFEIKLKKILNVFISRLRKTVGNRVNIDFTKIGLEEGMIRLKNELILVEKDENCSTIKTADPRLEENFTSFAVTPNDFEYNNKPVINWTEVEVNLWFKNRNISFYITDNLSPCDGKILEQLYQMSKEVPEFFYSTLRADAKANIRDIAYFTSELRNIFKLK